jgi:hypothetical protein
VQNWAEPVRIVKTCAQLRAARPFDQATDEQVLQELYAHYPTAEALLTTAMARMTGGE